MDDYGSPLDPTIKAQKDDDDDEFDVSLANRQLDSIKMNTAGTKSSFAVSTIPKPDDGEMFPSMIQFADTGPKNGLNMDTNYDATGGQSSDYNGLRQSQTSKPFSIKRKSQEDQPDVLDLERAPSDNQAVKFQDQYTNSRQESGGLDDLISDHEYNNQ